MTYEYVCTSCGHQWESEQSISAAPLRDCPKCKRASAKRQISGGTGFLLKGGGWYADGYGSASGSAKGESSSGETTKASESATSSTSDASGAKDTAPKEASTKDAGSKAAPARKGKSSDS